MATTTAPISIQLSWEGKPTLFYPTTQDGTTHRLAESNFKVTRIQAGCAIYRGVGRITDWGRFEKLVKPQMILFCTPTGKDNDNTIPVIVLKAFFHTDKALDGHHRVDWEECQETMQAEANFYYTALSNFQGLIVPKHYGIWRSEKTSSIGVVECQILQYGGKAMWGMGMNAKRRLAIASAIETLHNHGIYHGELGSDRISHHILCNEEDKVFIVDFAMAGDGLICTRTIPVVPMKDSAASITVDDWRTNEGLGKIRLCGELESVSRFLSFSLCERGFPKEVLEDVASLVIDTREDLQDKKHQFERQRQILEDWTKARSDDLWEAMHEDRLDFGGAHTSSSTSRPSEGNSTPEEQERDGDRRRLARCFFWSIVVGF
ncbi:hypothetical protein VNI00_014490 [Paramarasmius palmivorus]|uniref:Protein kinase domain-containing protein n=1 Tax=Paramarasmius palmivorus TaxID=297713 RepID=A0AAW0BSF7_9AGAR